MLVIGGGITGAGVALDAATRGLKVALVDKGDFASGTSSKSSKLVHGGLRYLQQREFRLVYENLRRTPAAAEQRAAPRRAAALPDPAVRQGRHVPEGDRQGLLGRAAHVRPHRRHPHRSPLQAPDQGRGDRAPADAARPTGSSPRSSTGTRRADDARLTLTIARTAADTRRGHRDLLARRSAATRRRRGTRRGARGRHDDRAPTWS